MSRRGLRLGSGGVLFVYVALHLANHSLGLLSLAVAEQGLRWTIGVWHGGAGSALLYGAAMVHITLALEGIYARRRLRLASLDTLRIFLGLGIPALLIGHAVGTRVAWELYAQSSQYERGVWSLWSAQDQGRQLALLVPGWMHGCLGIYLAFGQRPGFRRMRWPLLAGALLLPALGALGFIAMGRELSSEPALRVRLDAGLVLPMGGATALGALRRTLFAFYLAAIAATFAARGVRAAFERRLAGR